ncbi:MAG: hypothetical protein A2293_00175 [Elusimicrobia bacterium RIFOXYB2_FULL_49_7]|nr:MAG: hypothetical protein A2293_00175 [Elusimicrobia bacterium RIFOXYB2_FULL_49_7]
MRIGIISDTHRNPTLHGEALDILIDKKHVDRIYHLGDDYRDAELEINRGIDLVRVPGLYCPEYADRSTDKVAFDVVMGVNIAMAHDIKDIPKNDLLCNDIILHGHLHKYEIRIENGKTFLNPGHLKSAKDKNQSPTFAFLDIDYGEVLAQILDMSGKPQLSMKLKKGESGLHKV